jgi:hypothetical protein
MLSGSRTMKIHLTAAIATRALAAGAAQAASTISYAGYETAFSAGDSLVTDFSNPSALPTGFTLGGTAAFLTGTSGARHRAGDQRQDPRPGPISCRP